MTTATLAGTGRPPMQVLHRYDRLVPAAPQPTTRNTLDHHFATGRATLRDVYDEHGALVYSICRRSLDPEASKDVTQEVFISAWKGRQQFDPDRGALAAWLVGIAKRRVIDHLRSERRHLDRRADEDGAVPATDGSVEQVADRMLVADGLRQLPDESRRMIEMAFIHDLTHQEIAERTGTPLGTVKSSIRRGLIRVKSHLESTHE